MSDLRKAAEMALETLCVGANDVVPNDIDERFEQAIQALRQALAQPEQEPVAWMMEVPDKNADRSVKMTSCEWVAKEWENPISLYAAPPKREWVRLTDEEKEKYVVAYFVDKYDRETAVTLMDDYEAVLKEKNT